MTSDAVPTKQSRVIAVARTAIAATAFSLAGVASAYVGPSFIQLPDTAGTWKGEPYKNWLKVDGNYWKGGPIGFGGAGGNAAAASGNAADPRRNAATGNTSEGARDNNAASGNAAANAAASGNAAGAANARGGRGGGIFGARNRIGPPGPRKGAGELVLAIDKDNPALPKLMDKCVNKTPMAEMTYAESADLARPMAMRPAEVPDYFEYKLKDVRFSECPIVADAPQQAIVVTFQDIEWLNWKNSTPMVEVKLGHSGVEPLAPSSKTKSFVLTWFAVANDVSDDQCPVMNAKPTEDQYYALVPEEEAAKERAALASSGGVNYQNGQMGMRGPNRLNVTMAPGIVKDPGHAEPQTKVARGIDLDGDGGKGKQPAGTCKHQNFAAPDGRAGIDNQLYRAQGCISSFQGHKGFIMQFSNNQMHDGLLSMLIQISGIDDERNDADVEVGLFYSLDPMAKNASGSSIAPDYTFRVTDDPQYTYFFRRVKGRIVDGVVLTDPVDEFQMNLGLYGTPPLLTLAKASMRLELTPDGTIKGVLGGYQDWRALASRYVSSVGESYHGFQQPALYNSLKRNADGLKDPITGQCNGISSAYDIEGVSAFIAPAPPSGTASGAE